MPLSCLLLKEGVKTSEHAGGSRVPLHQGSSTPLRYGYPLTPSGAYFRTPPTRGSPTPLRSLKSLTNQQSSLAFGAHFPAIAVRPGTTDSAIVRAARESDFSRIGRPIPSSSVGIDQKERRILMGISDAAGMETASLLSALGNLLSSVGKFLILQLEWILAPRPGLAVAAGGEGAMDSGIQLIMKVMIFSIKSDKFTGFFDKFLKCNTPASGCNQKGFHVYLSVLHSDLVVKKFFGNPAFPRNSPQLRAGVRVRRPGRERPPG